MEDQQIDIGRIGCDFTAGSKDRDTKRRIHVADHTSGHGDKGLSCQEVGWQGVDDVRRIRAGRRGDADLQVGIARYIHKRSGRAEVHTGEEGLVVDPDIHGRFRGIVDDLQAGGREG